MTKLRGALYGCGMISEFHLRAWNRIDDVQIVAVGNRTVCRAERRRDQFAPKARVYSDLSELLDNERLDFLDVVTIPSLHKEHCLRGLDAGVHVICQKPLSDALPEAREMIDAFARRNRMLAVHENHRFRPWYQEILRRSSERFFGTIRFVRFEQFDCEAPLEAYKLESSHGILLEYGTHIIDMLHALSGRPEGVWGRACRMNSKVAGPSLVHLGFDYPGMMALVNIAWKESGIPHGGVTIVGDQGEAHFGGTMTRGERSRFRLVQRGKTVVDQSRSPYSDYAESFLLFQRAFVSALQGHGKLPQPANENLNVLRTTFAAYSAIDSGKYTPIHDFSKGNHTTDDHEIRTT